MIRFLSNHAVLITVCLVLSARSTSLGSQAGPDAELSRTDSDTPQLSPAAASNFAGIALRCVQKEYPNKPDHVISDSTQVQSPRMFHPAFYGCFDWHSSVHGHWVLVRIIRLHPGLPEETRIRTVLSENLTAANIAQEVMYLQQPDRKSFERTYGWAWLLKLAQELHEWNDPDARRWSEHLEPLSQAIAKRFLDFLPRQNYPIRTGVHPNTAFGLTFALDYARAVGDSTLEALIIERSLTYYRDDRDCPFGWEPGGEDFFSPCLMEADLMRRVLNRKDFEVWMKRFGGDAQTMLTSPVFTPAIVTDRTDPKLVHLDGLNLSRAWCMNGIASRLPRSSPLRTKLISSARDHAKAGLAHIASGHYEGEHWLASFAVLMLDSF